MQLLCNSRPTSTYRFLFFGKRFRFILMQWRIWRVIFFIFEVETKWSLVFIFTLWFNWVRLLLQSESNGVSSCRFTRLVLFWYLWPLNFSFSYHSFFWRCSQSWFRLLVRWSGLAASTCLILLSVCKFWLSLRFLSFNTNLGLLIWRLNWLNLSYLHTLWKLTLAL
jgi:hypothetical protein